MKKILAVLTATALLATSLAVTIEMDILQNDYQTVLTTKLNSGNVPDLFMTSAYSDNTTYKDYIYDITNESFVKSIDPALLSSVSVDGKVTGYPFLVQAHSFIYNKDLFEQAGITTLPKTLDEYKAVCEKLNAINIQPFSSGFGEWWVMPQTTYPSMSDAYEGDYTKLFSDVQSGTLNFGDLPQVDYALDLLDLIKDNSGKKPMESTFDVQVSDMASGKVAMIHQGTWAEGSIRAISPDINIGFLQA
ncbi:MAG: extracellular solute-binding protein, partial [Herbinix sp.]|nr:extracellular solute-binding protein [Herbinix sp.]